MKQSDPGFVYVVMDARCADPTDGRLRAAFQKDELPREARDRFKRHMSACASCAIKVANEEAISRAGKHFRLPVGPELARRMTVVKVPVPPPLPRRVAR